MTTGGSLQSILAAQGAFNWASAAIMTAFIVWTLLCAVLWVAAANLSFDEQVFLSRVVGFFAFLVTVVPIIVLVGYTT